uniref:UDP-glucuronosyltransferase n=1 Tax=Panagrellus redivivus TaxID=6233 RepID=A0A7E4USJ6_PANRE
MRTGTLLLTALLAGLAASLNGENILVFNLFFAHSHYAFQNTIADTLSDAGFNVTTLIPEIDLETAIKLPQKSAILTRSPRISSFSFSDQNAFWTKHFEMYKYTRFWKKLYAHNNEVCERLLTDNVFIDRLRAMKFTFAVMEPLDLCGFGLIELLGIKDYAVASPMPISDQGAYALGFPGRKYAVNTRNYDFHPNLSLYERIENFITPIFYHYFQQNGLSLPAVRKYVDPNFNPDDIFTKARYVFANTDEYIDFPRPLNHKVVYIGGVSVDQQHHSPLPAHYQELLDTAKQGVVLVSFGSLAKASAMPDEFKSAFIQMFEAFPKVDFIWKYENTSDAVVTNLPNVHLETWVPQKEILAHPKTLAFLSHGGMNSVLEAAYAGVPLLGIPLFADQMRNVKMSEYRRTGVVVRKTALNAPTLIAAMAKLLSPEYQNNADTLAQLIETKPQSGKDRFVKHIRHAVSFPGIHDYLDFEFRKASYIRYHDLDIYFLFSIAGIALISIFAILFRTIVHILAVTVKDKSE